MRRRTFTVRTPTDSGEIAAIEFGDPSRAVDVVFVHANGFNALTYRSVLEPLAERLRIIAIDLQGHGRSAQRVASEERRDWLLFRDDLAALIDQLDDAPLVLAGHSMGGAASIMAAAIRPQRVKAVALFDPVVMGGEQRAANFGESPLAVGARRRRALFASREEALGRYRGRGVFATWPDRALEDYVTDGFRDLPSGEVELSCAPSWEAANFSSHDHDTLAALRQLRMRVSIFRAEVGSTCSVASTDDFDNPSMTVETVAGTTHFLPLERPELVRETVSTLASL